MGGLASASRWKCKPQYFDSGDGLGVPLDAAVDATESDKGLEHKSVDDTQFPDDDMQLPGQLCTKGSSTDLCRSAMTTQSRMSLASRLSAETTASDCDLEMPNPTSVKVNPSVAGQRHESGCTSQGADSFSSLACSSLGVTRTQSGPGPRLEPLIEDARRSGDAAPEDAGVLHGLTRAVTLPSFVPKGTEEPSCSSTSVLAPSGSALSAHWQRPENVLLLLDWDDTICPTSWLVSRPWFRIWQAGLADLASCAPPDDLELLSELDKTARAFVLAAARFGRVCCVTLAQRPWQSRSMEAFLPRLARTWHKLGVEVCYATEEKCMSACEVPPWVHSAQDPYEHAVVREAMQVTKKQLAMQRLIRRFYRTSNWKNVLNFGDGLTEHNAVQEIAFQFNSRHIHDSGVQRGFLVKSVKMIEEPDCAQLCAELQMLTAWLPSLVSLMEDHHTVVDEREEELLDTCQRLKRLAERVASSKSSLQSPGQSQGS
mmetsp:Transcript_55423/g.129013  ORF Transcript_55423/g.129013 Transcript_55423/m.129013 type:complete len:485 (+) Transcript_55423:68-1522(+)